MKIGELASRAGVNVQTVRYYERRNILRPSSVSVSGYRLYKERDLQKLRFIKQTQELGFTLSDVEGLLRLRANSQSSCRSVAQKASATLENVRDKIRLLHRIEDALQGLIATCKRNDGTNVCPFLDDLDS